MLKHEEFEKICRLAKISIEKDKEEQFLARLDGVFEWINQLNTIDVSSVELDGEKSLQGTPEACDESTMENTREQILSNTKNTKFGMFCVPKVVE